MRRNIPRAGYEAVFRQKIPCEHQVGHSIHTVTGFKQTTVKVQLEQKTRRPLTSTLCIISLDVVKGVLGGPDFESREEDMQP